MFIVAADAMEQEGFLSSDTIVLITSLVPLLRDTNEKIHITIVKRKYRITSNLLI